MSYEVIVEFEAINPRSFATFETFYEAAMAHDAPIEEAAGRHRDFSGSDFRTRDMGWWVDTVGEAKALRQRIIDDYKGEAEILVRLRHP